MSTYKIKKYEPMKDAHLLIDEDTDERISVDLMLNGEIEAEAPVDLVGKRVEIEKLTPYLMLADDVEVL